MHKIKIISDKNKRSVLIKNIILKKIKNFNLYNLKLIIVIGGDGFMLQVLKRKKKSSNNFFYGVNSGNYGFLMNKFSSKNILRNLRKAKVIKISP